MWLCGWMSEGGGVAGGCMSEGGGVAMWVHE